MNTKQRDALISLLKSRFESNMNRHANMKWAAVAAKLQAEPDCLRSFGEMERTGGEPDVVDFDARAGEILFVDCAADSPIGRRSLCYDGAALAARKEAKPIGSACEAAASMGVALLTENQYRALQQFGAFDLKTSSWLATPASVRTLGGALFCRSPLQPSIRLSQRRFFLLRRERISRGFAHLTLPRKAM
jgi:hypothetical protein